MTRSRAAFFDLDGTLLDTARDMAAALNVLLAEQGRAALALEVVRPRVSNGAIALVRLGFPELSVDSAEFEKLRERFLAHYRSALCVHTQLFPGFEAVLATLEAHALPWGVITNKAAWLTEPLLESLGLSARAACVVSGDTLPQRKPHPQQLLHAAELIAVAPSECIYLGDALRDVQAARAAGMVPLGARFGYVNSDDDPTSWPVAGWLDDPHDLLSWLALPPGVVH
ncbi:MAG TPA: phosphoglycolate phosphatase [Steroidobacteraceae bacterium]|jgi:phosphoglycolate phosphatase|nr:phosphoglycolate phosphatase [Steroidobacteraceae bacterium]